MSNSRTIVSSWSISIFLLASAGLLVGLPACAEEVDEPKTERPPALAVYDANPQFLHGVKLPIAQEEANAAWKKLSTAGVPRAGAAADGVSLLLLRVEFNQPGQVRFSLVGEKPRGRLASVHDLQEPPGPLPTKKTVAGRYAAVAVYVPPEVFGEDHAGEGAFSREMTVVARLGPADAEAKKPPADLELRKTFRIVRPPVVLVHGLYHNPEIGFKTPPRNELGEGTLLAALQLRGFKVFIVDYEKSNGARNSGPSGLWDNRKVVWENAGGIRDALAAYRKLGFAVTQADVVGHSMGGLLARAYAKGKPLLSSPDDKTNRPQGSEHSPDENWYLRPDNFMQGDINRLITFCTPHHGSNLVRLILRLKESAEAVGTTEQGDPRALFKILDLAYNTSSAAFADQDLHSRAIAAIGPTRVPAHAIAATASPLDYSHFNGIYRWNYLSMMLLTPPDLVKRLLEHPDIGRSEDAARLLAFVAEHPHLKAGIIPKMLAAQAGRRVAEPTDEKLQREYAQALGLFDAVVFQGEANDGAVSQSSAKGGLEDRYTTTTPHVLHTFAGRYAQVQKRIVELLEGRLDPFSPSGFPATVEHRKPSKSPRKTIPARKAG